MATTIAVTANGTYNTFGTESYLDGQLNIRGGGAGLKVSDGIDGATVTPQVDYNDNSWAPLGRDDGATAQTVTIDCALELRVLRSGMRLRFVVTDYSSPFTISVLG